MKNLNEMLTEMESLLPHFEKINKEVSIQSIGWQTSHSLLVINSVCKEMIKSDPKTYKWKFNLRRIIVLTSGNIPRQKVRAPKNVTPETFDLDSVKSEIINAKSLVKRLYTLDKNAHFIHPFFGDINLKTTKRFLAVHTEHHLKIMRDILK